MKAIRGFASDNCSGIHPRIMEGLVRANTGHVPSYGDDIHTCAAVLKFREHFGPDCDVHFVWGGTAANVLGLKAVTEPYNAVICAETAHINVHECGAPERFTGCKLLTVPTEDGKLTPEGCGRFLDAVGDQHMVQPRVISISQPTELGTVYTVEELKGITDFAHGHGMVVHVDGARLANAAVHLGETVKGITFDAGVDLLSFGGTKSGMMCGEAVVFPDKRYAGTFPFIRKQGMQLSSKMRFIAAQFEALLTDGLLYEIAAHTNGMARLLAERLERIPGIEITQRVQSNAVFAIIPPRCVAELRKRFHFYVVNEEKSEVRLMCSFDTTEEDVARFVEAAGKFMENGW